MAWPCITRACCINRFWTELDKADIAVPLVFTKYSDVADVQHLAHHPQPRQKRPGPGPGAAGAVDVQPHPGAQDAGGAAERKDDGSAASVMRQDFKAWRVRPEPSCKPRSEYQRSAAPFNNETQYQKDYKPWPIPKKHDHPWIPKPSPTSSSKQEMLAVSAEAESGVEKSEIEEKTQEKEKEKPKEKVVKREKSAERRAPEKTEAQEESAEQRRSRAAADALNRQIKEVSSSSSYRQVCVQ